MLGGATVVVPIEMNPEEDALHDDEVRLWSVRGSYDRTLYASDPEVEPDRDSRLMHYRFGDVPFGVYRTAVCVAGEWHDLATGIVVAQDGVYLGGKKLASDKPTLQVAEPEPLASEDGAPPENDPEYAMLFTHGTSMEGRGG